MLHRQRRHLEPREHRIAGHDGESLELRLGDQHAVDVVAALMGERPGQRRMLRRHGQRAELRLGDVIQPFVGDLDPSLSPPALDLPH